MSKLNEKELRKLFQELRYKNRNLAIEKIYYKYKELVYGVAFSILKNREEAEEIVQNVFLKLYTIDKMKLPSNNESSWLYKVTKNEAISNLRKKKNNVNLDYSYDISDEDNDIRGFIDKDEYNLNNGYIIGIYGSDCNRYGDIIKGNGKEIFSKENPNEYILLNSVHKLLPEGLTEYIEQIVESNK